MTDPHQEVVTRRSIGPIVLVLGITLVTGAVYGRLIQRWGPVPDLLAAAAHLETFPQQIGDWQLLSKAPLEESTVQMLSCAGYVNRQYVNAKTGATVSIAMMLGPPGPIAVHTPEVCYSSRAYSIQEARKQVSMSDSTGQTHSFWSVSFHSNTPSAERLHVCYAWHGRSAWEAATSPRFKFAGRPFLVKLQIASRVPMTRDSAETSRDPCEEFLLAMLRSGWSVSG